MFHGELVLPETHSRKILYASPISFISSAYAWHRGYYDLMFVPGSVGISSVLYWVYPDYSWRRTFDIAVVQIALWYQVYRVWSGGATFLMEYCMFTATSILFFVFGLISYRKNHLKLSTFSHCSLHIIANIGNLIVYSGEI